MTADDALVELLDRVGRTSGRSALFTAEELEQWPIDAVTAMKAVGLLAAAAPASSVPCPGCERYCFMPVHVYPAEQNRPARAFISCDKPEDVGTVTVPIGRLGQWQASGDSIAALLADLLSLSRSTRGARSEGRWELGLFRGSRGSSHLVLRFDQNLTLALAGHSIPVAEVLTLHDGEFVIDERRITRSVDQPVAGAGDMESAAQRRARLRGRVQQVKARGTKAFLKTVAAEEGISISRLKQLLADDSSLSRPQLPW
jgi:hypothetical protein